MTHRDGFPRFSARSAWRGDARHRKPCAPSTRIAPSESPGPQDLGKPPFRSRGRSGGGRIGGGAGKPRRCPASPARSLWVIINESWFLKPSSPAKNPAGPPPRQTRVALLSNGHGGRIAQLVEQLTLNQRVRGSSPRAPPTLNPAGSRPWRVSLRRTRGKQKRLSNGIAADCPIKGLFEHCEFFYERLSARSYIFKLCRLVNCAFFGHVKLVVVHVLVAQAVANPPNLHVSHTRYSASLSRRLAKARAASLAVRTR